MLNRFNKLVFLKDVFFSQQFLSYLQNFWWRYKLFINIRDQYFFEMNLQMSGNRNVFAAHQIIKLDHLIAGERVRFFVLQKISNHLFFVLFIEYSRYKVYDSGERR